VDGNTGEVRTHTKTTDSLPPSHVSFSAHFFRPPPAAPSSRRSWEAKSDASAATFHQFSTEVRQGAQSGAAQNGVIDYPLAH
jgi:hypothetical protein